eukprot:scaffold654439_cov39-Prasinocladus_malaysianus.AAC.1
MGLVRRNNALMAQHEQRTPLRMLPKDPNMFAAGVYMSPNPIFDEDQDKQNDASADRALPQGLPCSQVSRSLEFSGPCVAEGGPQDIPDKSETGVKDTKPGVRVVHVFAQAGQ